MGLIKYIYVFFYTFSKIIYFKYIINTFYQQYILGSLFHFEIYIAMWAFLLRNTYNTVQ